MFVALIALAIAGLIALAVKLTIKFLKSYRKKKQSKMLLANMGSLIQNIPNKDKRTFSLEELEELEDQKIIAEYDENTDEVIQANFIGSKGMEDRLDDALEINDGVLIIQ